LYQVADVGASRNIYLQLVGRDIIFEVFQPMWSRYLSVTEGQADGRTDRRHTWYCGITVVLRS